MDVKDLPPYLRNNVKRMIKDSKSYTRPLKMAPKGSADHFNYKISVEGEDNEMILEANQYNLNSDLKTLIKYLETELIKKHTSDKSS